MRAAELTSVSEAWACPARKRARVLCVASLAMSLALYALSPFVTLWTIARSVETHDMLALGQTINWTSLDASLKEQVLDGLNLGHATEAADELPEFGASFATNVVSNAVDLTVTQQNLGMVVDQAMGATAPGKMSASTMLSAVGHAVVRFTGGNTFEAAMVVPGHETETPLRVQLRIERWQWKLTRVDLPAPVPHPVMEASLSSRRPA
ncbi:hypothetical protein AA0472_1417 [Acetobacter estunensis NRIC 0472]|uniref:DUF2939 domain-containing protein n=1 Tax=Acetobacter estunensis TaxID=104097 RepID=A0A967B510_9PROT|nr:DUF2939 domain-containing protein [Acetobacter estunensis]NHO53892.1 DUF2939 domain-containing protein [Acetobacter estunensis]GBQ24418.1 hypothetical protein AA0472_1417 [Acetobacter estunensis NRIC 0472]